MAISEALRRSSPSTSRSRRYLPFVVVLIGVFLTVTVLPSVLNINQPNPSQTLEYAPVSPEGDETPPGGNLSSLGLGFGGRGLGPTGSPVEAETNPSGVGARPSTKRCVGNPPRQTEDPLSPPCVAFFDGDNGGAISTGVTRTELKVLIYMSGGASTLCDEFVDLAGNVPNEQAARSLAMYQRYFNDRFQTYGRFVHFILQRGKCNNYTPEARRADAELGYVRVKPFAAVSFAVFGNQEAYVETLANRGVVTFLSRQAVNFPNNFFTRFPGFIYGYNPTIEQFAESYASFVCSKVVPFPVSFSGNPLDDNIPRKLGHLYPVDPAYPEIKKVSELIAEKISECGGRIALTRNFSEASVPLSNTGPDDSQEAAQNMAEFRRNGITTILWTGGNESAHSRSAAAIHYRPEFLLLGVMGHDRNFNAAVQDQSVWRNAWVISISTLVEAEKRQLCYAAGKEVDPEISDFWATSGCFIFYPSIRQLFTGIQVAGARPTSRSMDRGFHAIPPVASKDPTVPACFYHPRDYSCVKDAISEWWDPSRRTEGGTSGCWIASEKGKRYLTGTWPREDVPARKSASDPCNNSL